MGWHDEPPRDDKEEKAPKKEQDIWSKPRKPNAAPPDLDALLRQLKKKIGDAFADKNRPGGKGPSEPGKAGRISSAGNPWTFLALVAIVVVLVWGLAGIFIVSPAEQAVILRFGKYQETVSAGPHWVPPFIESTIVVDVDKVSDYSYSAKMLTKDENIVSVSVAIQYRIGNLENYLFNAADPQESLQQATASALRQVVGHSTLNEIIAEGREVWGQNVEVLLNRILESYKVGIVITNVAPQPARAPEEVQDAFDDAINAQEDEKRFKEQAYAYSASVVPIAEGKAKRIMAAASADEKRAIFKAEGETAAFNDLLAEYLHAPDIMKQRLYLEMMENVLDKTTKILVDDKNSKNMMYLPLDALMKKTASEDNVSSNYVSPAVYPAASTETREGDQQNQRSDARNGGRN
jgi:membrane protease subunit HflK